MNEFLKKLLKLIMEDADVLKSLSEEDVKEIKEYIEKVKTKKLEFITFKNNVQILETKNEDGSLRLTAIASTDSVDRGDDIVIPTGIKTTNIKNNLIPMFLNHDLDKMIGGWDKWYVKDNKFIVEGTFLAPVLDWQKDAMEKVKSKVLNGISIGFMIEKVSFDKDIRILEEIELYEVSVVSVPMNQDCYITEVKNLNQSSQNSADVKGENQVKDASVVNPDLDTLTKSVEQLTEEIAKLKKENEDLKQEVSSLKTEITDYEAVMDELNKETEELLKSKGVLL